jgi:hypothetical protein
MPSDTSIRPIRPRVSITLSSSTDPLPAAVPTLPASTTLLPETIVLDPQSRTSMWAGFAEGCRAIAEAEERVGAPLSREDLHALYDAYFDAYEPHWWPKGSISDDWLTGWSRAFALAALQVERRRFSESPRPGCEVTMEAHLAAESGEKAERSSLRFRQASIQVSNTEDFWQGVWEGQMAAVDVQGWLVAVCSSGFSGSAPHPGPPPSLLSSVQIFDEFLEIMRETGNLGLDFVAGYFLGFCEGVLSGRQRYPAKGQAYSA